MQKKCGVLCDNKLHFPPCVVPIKYVWKANGSGRTKTNTNVAQYLNDGSCYDHGHTLHLVVLTTSLRDTAFTILGAVGIVGLAKRQSTNKDKKSHQSVLRINSISVLKLIMKSPPIACLLVALVVATLLTIVTTHHNIMNTPIPIKRCRHVLNWQQLQNF